MEKLHSQKLAPGSAAPPTQKYLDVQEVKEDVVVLKSGALRSILAVSSINFDLKSTEEQEAIISQYQNFLNSVDFPIQILVSSRKLNMENYLDFLTSKEKTQPNELLRMQISEYKNFIAQLVSVSNIMDKNFYIIIPFSPIESKEKGFFSNLMSLIDPKKNILEKRENFETYKSQLFQRVDHVIAALSGIGLKIIPLKTEELIELLFDFYNPEVYNAVEIREVEKLELSR
jgi:type IV secretory pathway VirB4 component